VRHHLTQCPSTRLNSRRLRESGAITEAVTTSNGVGLVHSHDVTVRQISTAGVHPASKPVRRTSFTVIVDDEPLNGGFVRRERLIVKHRTAEHIVSDRVDVLCRSVIRERHADCYGHRVLLLPCEAPPSTLYRRREGKVDHVVVTGLERKRVRIAGRFIPRSACASIRVDGVAVSSANGLTDPAKQLAEWIDAGQMRLSPLTS
jgi:hypothetical protein